MARDIDDVTASWANLEPTLIVYIEIQEKWITTPVADIDLKPLGITAEELWESRNGLLHMTNLDSRAVGRKKVRRISLHSGAKPFYEHDGVHYFNFYELLMEVGRSHVRWLETYNHDFGKRVDFVSCYDKTISDSSKSGPPIAPYRFRIDD